MSDKIYDVPAEWRKRAFVDDAKYKEMYDRSIKDPNGFWAEQAKRIDWIKPFSKVKNTSYDPHNVSIKWFEDGTLNACHNCVDRHLAKRGDQTPSSGKATIRRTTRNSLTSNCTPRSAASPTS